LNIIKEEGGIPLTIKMKGRVGESLPLRQSSSKCFRL